jgi:NAD-dependent DNA ligase
MGKKMKNPFDIDALKANPMEYVQTLSAKKVEQLIGYLDEQYYNNVEIVSDSVYDDIRERFLSDNPDSKIKGKIGAPPVSDGKVKLKYWMGSMDKVKGPVTKAALEVYLDKHNDQDRDELMEKWETLSEKKKEKYQAMADNYNLTDSAKVDSTLKGWSAKNPGQCLVSDKLDGLSCLYDNGSLYTRGEGDTGRDVSHLSEYLGLPKQKVVVRGEIVISRENFKKFPDEKKPRTMVGGVVNSKHPNKTKAKHLEFVAYELLEPRVKPSDQMKELSKLGFKTVYHRVLNSINAEVLTAFLTKRGKKSDYQIDGIIVTQDASNAVNASGNPKYAFAYKQPSGGVVTEVLDIEWNPSRHGVLVPRVCVELVVLDGSDVVHATGKNAKFILDNKIGPGAKVKIAMGGDVIPDIIGVLKTAKVELPDLECHWNETKVNLILDDASDNVEVLKRQLIHFVKKMNIEFMGKGMIDKIVDGGYDTIEDIVCLTEADFLTLPGVQKKMATKLANSLQSALKKTTLCQWMVASNKFGSGLGDKKLKAILEKYPDIWESKADRATMVAQINKIDGFQTKTSEKFADNLKSFQEFWTQIKGKVPMPLSITPPSKTVTAVKSHPEITNKTFLFTGFRDQELQNLIESYGGLMTDGMKFDVLICQNKSSASRKTEKAKDKGLPIFDKSEFKNKFF